MMVTTTFSFEGYRIREYKGIVRGIIVRSPTITQGILGGLKNIIGGSIGAYTEMCEQARQQAYDLLLEHASKMGANAIVGASYDASEVVSKGSATEVLCYGTAVGNLCTSSNGPSPGLRPPSPRYRGARGNSDGHCDLLPSPRVRGEGARSADEGRATCAEVP
jgi:uncharacterized protein YbjQ (UPF0145 family)